MRLLLVTADPTNEARLQVGREDAEIDDARLRSDHPDWIDVKLVNAATVGRLSDWLVRHRPHLIHFAGHGTAAGIKLQDDAGKSVTISGQQLADLLRAAVRPVECVIFNSCYSQEQAHAVAATGAVAIGTDGEIIDKNARAFSKSFYQALFAEWDYGFAYDMAVANLGHEVDEVRFHLVTPDDGEHTGNLPRRALMHRWDLERSDALAIIGRERELAEIIGLLHQPDCNLIAVYGAAGIGKTTLSTALCGGIPPNLEVDVSVLRSYDPIWVPLVNVPDLRTVADAAIGAGGEAGALLSTDDDVTRLTSFLAQHRHLLVLDNFESVLAAEDQRADEYNRLLSAVAETPLKSCVLLTTRKLPPIADPSRKRSPRVRAVEVEGMSAADIKKIVVRDTELTGTDFDWERLATLFGGNPLSIILAARHIADVYDRQISGYLNNEHHTFRAVEELLDWHLDRLADAERELAQWLAIERQPTPVGILTANVSTRTRRRYIGDTLQRLMRDLPVQRLGAAVVLQPVLIETICEHIAQSAANELLTNGSDTLRRLALLQATATEPVRRGQHSALLGRVIEICRDAGMGSDAIRQTCLRRLATAQSDDELVYLAGNLVNLLIALGTTLNDVDLGGLTLRQVDFRAADLRGSDLSSTRLTECGFRDAFGSILAVRLSPDADLLAAGGADGKVRLWNVATGQSQAVIAASQKWVRSIDFAPSRNRLVVAADDNTVRSWSLDGSQPQDVSTHDDWVMIARYSQDGRFIASAGNSRKVVLRFANGTQSTHDLHGARIRCLSISSDDQLIVTGDERGTAIVWSVPDSLEVQRFECRWAIRGIAFADGDAAVLAATEHGSLHRWDLADRAFTYVVELHDTPIRSLAYREVGDRAVTAAESGEIAVVSAADGAVLRRLTAHGKRLQAVDIGSGDLCASGGEDQAVRLWNMRSGDAVRIFSGYANPAWSCVWSPDGQSVLIGYEDGWLRIYQRHGDAEPVREFKVLAARLRTICIPPDPALMAVVAGDDRRLVALAHDGRIVAEGGGHEGRITVLISPPGQLLSASGDGTIRTWTRKAATLSSETLHQEPAAINCLTTSPDGCLIAFGGDARHLRVMELASGQLIVNQALPDRVWSVSFTAAGDELYAGCGDGRVYRVSLDKQKATTSFDAHDGWVWSVHTHPGGVMTGGEDGLVKSWTAAVKPDAEQLIAASDRVRVVALSPAADGGAAVCDDGTAWIWDVGDFATMRTVRPVRPYEGLVISELSGLQQGTLEALRALGASMR